MDEESEERRVSGANANGREENVSGSERDDWVQEAIDEGEIKWKLQ